MYKDSEFGNKKGIMTKQTQKTLWKICPARGDIFESARVTTGYHKVPASDECKDNLTRRLPVHDRVRDSTSSESINFQQFQQESKNLGFGKSLVALPGWVDPQLRRWNRKHSKVPSTTRTFSSICRTIIIRLWTPIFLRLIMSFSDRCLSRTHLTRNTMHLKKHSSFPFLDTGPRIRICGMPLICLLQV